MRIRHKFWLEENSEVLFGRGRYMLLRTVDELGSLSAAAKKMKMSYRAAWGRVRASEERLGLPLMEKAPVGRGLVLTDQARKLIEMYRRFEDEIDALVREKGSRIFGAESGLDLVIDDEPVD